METLDLLEELLLDYQGTILIVSHDRSFLNNVVTSSLIFSGNGRIDEIIGGYNDWLETQSKPKTSPKKDHVKPTQRKERPQKLSFKEKIELEKLPEKIDALEAEQTEIHAQIADPHIYKEGDGALITTLKKRLQTVEIELEETYLRWEKLDQIPK
jgi:ATP-binding cassette subfamily F protein uup